jgi:hypothetical protein
MRNPFPGISDEAFKELSEKRRKFQYLASWQWPMSWVYIAERHKLAANVLYKAACKAYQRDTQRLLAELKKPKSTGSTSRQIVGEELRDLNLKGLFADYLLLSGYALECVTKGLVMARNPDLVHDERKLKKRVATHDIGKLCDMCGIKLTTKERNLMGVITRNIEWGKYPAPIHLDQTTSPIDPDDQQQKSLSVSNPFHEDHVQKAVDAVYLRALRLLSACKATALED